MEGETKQAIFDVQMGVALDDIQELLGRFATGVLRDNQDSSILFQDIEPIGTIGRWPHPHRQI